MRLGLPLLVGLHPVISAAVEALFAGYFGHSPRAVATHVLLIAEGDLALYVIVKAIASFARSGTWPGVVFRLLFALTCTLQLYLYALSAVSNAAWGRNITGHLVVAFARTVWSGKEPFPLGAPGITVFTLGTLVAIAAVITRFGGTIDAVRRNPLHRLRLVVATAAV